jgi:hypothetical protein
MTVIPPGHEPKEKDLSMQRSNVAKITRIFTLRNSHGMSMLLEIARAVLSFDFQVNLLIREFTAPRLRNCRKAATRCGLRHTL